MLCQGCGAGKVRIPQPAQVLIAKAGLPLHTQAGTELGVVAEFRMRIQRQVVGKQIDVIGHQQTNALLEPARDAPIHAAPEQAVMHKNSIGPGVDRRFNQGTAGGHAADHSLNLAFTFDLQAIGPVIFESFRLQQLVEAG